MRRLLILVLLVASLVPGSGPARAQATADQLNRLSLEALTAPSPGGGGGYSRRGGARSYSRHSGYSRRGGGRHGSHRSYASASRTAYRGHYAGRTSRGGRHAHRHHRYHRAR